MKKHYIYQENIYRHIIMSVLYIIGISTIVAMFIHGFHLFSSFYYYVKYTSFGWVIGFTFLAGHTIIGYYTAEKLDWMKNPKKANIISLLSYIIYGIIVCPFIPYLFCRFTLGMTGQDLFINALIMALMMFSIDMIVISIFYSTYLTKYWIKAIESNEELKRENLIAKYEALKNQVNPHFLFNSLNTLSGVVEQKPELATDFIKKLSDIYRYVLDQNDKELVTLTDEMKFVEDYVFLLKMRFREGLIFSSNITNDQKFQVVPLGIQMLVENSIKHNIISDDKPLRIEMEINAGFIIVRNNLQKKRTIISGKEPLGLENLKKRYAYLSDARVEVIESDSKFIVKLPIIEP